METRSNTIRFKTLFILLEMDSQNIRSRISDVELVLTLYNRLIGSMASSAFDAKDLLTSRGVG